MIEPNWTKLLTCAALPILTSVLWAGSPQSPSDPANSSHGAKVELVSPNSADSPASTQPRAVASAIVQVEAAAMLATLPGADSPYAQPSASQLESPSTSDSLTAGQIQSLPLPRRNWESFVFDSPGPAITAAADNSQASRTVNRTFIVTVDGAGLRVAFGDTATGRAPVRSPSLMGPSSEAAIREVQSITHFADNGANIVTEHGTNRLHGQGFVFDRQNLWSAKNPFTRWVRETAPATLITTPTFTAQPWSPPDREWIAGVGLGGVLRRDRLFWFASIDGFQRTDPGVSTVKHPDNFFAQPSNDRMQVLSARLGLTSPNPVAAGLAAFSRMLETLDELLGPAPRTSSRWSGFGRLDWKAGERNRFTLEGNGSSLDSPGGGLTRASEAYGTHSFGSRSENDMWLLGRWEAFVTPNLLAVTQGSLGGQIQRAPAEAPSPYERTLNISAWGQLPQIVVDSRYGFTIGNPARFGQGSYPDEKLYHAQEQLDWVRGTLLLRTGFAVDHNRDATSRLRNQTGTYYYSTVENFASDALAFASFGLNGQLDPMDQHNCDQTGKVWSDSTGTLHGLGYLPCYSYYAQTMGPSNWWLSTNDWSGYVTSQWQPKKQVALSLAIRWEREQLPPPLAALANPDLPLTRQLAALGNEWGPRAGLALGSGARFWPVLRFGYGMYFGRIPNATVETVRTNTGSMNGDLNFFMRPTDNLNAGGAPPFPYVLAGQPSTVVKPAAVEFAPGFRNGEIHQAEVAMEQSLPWHLHLEASAAASLGRRLPITLDANIDPAINPRTITYTVVDGSHMGPIKTPNITVPFYASWPSVNSSTGFAGRLNANYQQVTEVFSRANSTYEAAMLRLVRSGRTLSIRAHYTYAHAMDWNPNETAQVTGSSVFDPTDLRQEYGTSNLDVRHSVSGAVIWEPRWNLSREAGRVINGWMLSGTGQYHSGLPYTMRTSGSLAKEFTTTGTPIVGLATGLNGYGGDNRVFGVGRNTYRYPETWKADVRLGKRINIGRERQLEFMAESFNLFNHQNVSELETVGYTIESGSSNGALPTLNYLAGLKPGQTEFGTPLNINATDFYRERQVQFGARVRF
jgi:hypothetical protein